MSGYGLSGVEKMDEGLRVKLATSGSSKSMASRSQIDS